MPHLYFAAPHKSSGKTTITLGVSGALKDSGLKVQSFKKGPDYIDPMWLSVASGSHCFNLDYHTMSKDEILYEFNRLDQSADISIIEGNMGLFDSSDVEGTQSNAAMAKLLNAAVILVIDVKGATRSIVPLIQGFINFDPELNIAGIILNNVAGKRHLQRLHAVIEHYCDIPIVGSVLRESSITIDERHLGLVPSNESNAVHQQIDAIVKHIANCVDLEMIKAIASKSVAPTSDYQPTAIQPLSSPIRIAIAKDEAFGFYYSSDLDRFNQLGVELVPFSPLRDEKLPSDIDGLLIGGGFPETHIDALQNNVSMREALYNAIVDTHIPTYAECGGLMYLCRSIEWFGYVGSMVGVIPGDVAMSEKPVGRGYSVISPVSHPWGLADQHRYSVHEFHYSQVFNLPDSLQYTYQVERGNGIINRQDGVVIGNLLANYIHLRDVDAFHWVDYFCHFVLSCKHRH